MENTLFNRIIADANRVPYFIDISLIEHCNSLTQTSNILLAISELATKKTIPYTRIEDISVDILLFLNQIRLNTGDDLYLKVWRWLKSKLRTYEAICNDMEWYELSNNFFKLSNCLKETIKTKKVTE